MQASPTQRVVSGPRCGRRGALVVLAAFCLLLVIGFLAFAVDVGYINVTSSELQNAADAGALSGVRRLALGETAAKAAAKTWAEKNVAGGQAVSVVSAADVQVGVWDTASATFTPAGGGVMPNAIQVTCRRLGSRGNALPLFIAPVLGQNTADVSATAIAVAKSTSSAGGTFRFLVDDEMFDTDEPGIQDLADAEGMTEDELLHDGDSDGFIDMPPGAIMELPTGQVGDEALFDMQSYNMFPFGAETPYTYLDFLAEGTALESLLSTTNLQDVEWHGANAPSLDLIGKKLLDPVLSTDPVSQHARILALPDPDVTHVTPVFKSDVAMQERDPSKYGSPTANLQGERRGLVAFRIMSARNNPKGGSYLPLLTIKIVDPEEIDLENLQLGSRGGGGGSSPAAGAQLVQ